MPADLKLLTLVIATGHALSLALGKGGCCLARHHRLIGLGHAEALMPALAALLEPHGGPAAPIGRIVVERGPGSFTGLRVGIAAARALALAWRVPVAGVRSTLLVAAAARAAGQAGPLGVALRAPRGQLWVERFAAAGLDPVGPVEALERVPDEPALHWIGSGLADPGSSAAGAVPCAAAALALDGRLFEAAVPLYVRRQDAGDAPGSPAP